MNSDKSDILLFTLPNLQNLDFYLVEVPDGKINRKEEREMERTFRLKEQSFTFDKKGMILRGRMTDSRKCILVRAWRYELDKLEPLETIKMAQLDYEMLKLVQKQGAKYICRDEGGVLNICDTEPYQSEYEEGIWWSTGETAYLNEFFSKLFQFVKWEDKKYYVIEDVLNNCEVVEDD